MVSCSVPPTRLWDCLNLLSLFKHSFINLILLIHKENSPLLILNEFSILLLLYICRLSEPRQPRNQMITVGVAGSHLPLGTHKPVITWNACLRLPRCINIAFSSQAHLIWSYTWHAFPSLSWWLRRAFWDISMGCDMGTENPGGDYGSFPKTARACWYWRGEQFQILPPESPEAKNQLQLYCNPHYNYSTRRNQGAISVALVLHIGKQSHNQAEKIFKNDGKLM